MQKIVIDIFMYIFEALLLLYYANTAFKARKTKFFSGFIILVVHVVLFGLYQLNLVYLNAILFFTLYSITIISLYCVKLKTAVFHAAIFCIVMLGSEIAVMGIGTILFSDFNALDNDKTAYMFVVVSSKLIYFIIMMMVLKFVVRTKDNDANNKYYWLMFIMPLSSLLMLLAFRYIAYRVELLPSMNLFWIVSSIIALFANIVVFILYEYSNKNTRELYELKAISRQEEQDKKYYDIVEQSNKEMRVFVHDIKNHFSYLQGLDNVEEIHNYIDSLSNDIEKSYYAGISKNKTLDLIIGKYFKLCEANNIKFSVDVKTSNLNYIDSVDLSTFLNNLLDNAFDAAKESKDAFIEFVVFSKNDSYDGLMIRNSCLNAPKTKDGQLVTTKRDKTMHGLGLTSIHKVLKKYNAMLDWKYDNVNHIFETHIVFNKN